MEYVELSVAAGLVAVTGLWSTVTTRRLRRPGNPPRRPQNGLPLLEAAYLAADRPGWPTP
ncbi:hypothetical protein ACFQ0T_11635 [Kitasatospora gansuensis]